MRFRAGRTSGKRHSRSSPPRSRPTRWRGNTNSRRHSARTSCSRQELARRQGALLAKLVRWYTPAEALAMATGTNARLLAMSGKRNPYPGQTGCRRGRRPGRSASGRRKPDRGHQGRRRSSQELRRHHEGRKDLQEHAEQVARWQAKRVSWRGPDWGHRSVTWSAPGRPASPCEGAMECWAMVGSREGSDW